MSGAPSGRPHKHCALTNRSLKGQLLRARPLVAWNCRALVVCTSRNGGVNGAPAAKGRAPTVSAGHGARPDGASNPQGHSLAVPAHGHEWKGGGHAAMQQLAA
uniref:Uncharacterized protein n=1 Tax=Chlamydomonas euryale TaxID=1486919 RepID=A0A7R9YTW5_9CHLO|eukprot:336403-Chlamydomonas_euryale.AAC.4